MRDRFETNNPDVPFLEIRYEEEAGVYASTSGGIIAITGNLDTLAEVYRVKDKRRFMQVATAPHALYQKRVAEILKRIEDGEVVNGSDT